MRRHDLVLSIDLTALEALGAASDPVPRPFAEIAGRPDPDSDDRRVRDDGADRGDRLSHLARIASWGGSALGLALLARRPVEEDDAPYLVLAAGEAVARELPTAERATLTARAPLTGLVSQGSVGGALGANLARRADALELAGRTTLRGAVLRLDAAGGARLESRPELLGLAPSRVREALAVPADAAVLCIGPGGERGLAFASLASVPHAERDGEDVSPSFVGRGGLGAVFGALGLKALVVERPDAAREEAEVVERARELQALLARSPRLAARADGGTFELVSSFGARGDLVDAEGAALAPDEANRLRDEARAARATRKGCRGCPTPCGWEFTRSSGGRQGARFSASQALGTRLGLDAFDDALGLLARCDALGVDAKEVGALLALELVRRRREGERELAGDAEALAALVDDLVSSSGDDADAVVVAMRRGAVHFARAFDLEAELVSVRGQAARRETNHASVLGQCVSTGGADPMRSFPFLIDASGREGLEALCGDLGPLPAGAEDPASPVAKGRLVQWHENLVAAVDATGFCAFSAAGVLADGLCDLDELARRILPDELAGTRPSEERDDRDEREAGVDDAWRALAPGRRLLAVGANLVLLRRELDARFGAAPDADRPEWARALLDAPGMLDEYRAWRGLDAQGRATEARRAALGTPDVLAPPDEGAPGATAPTAPSASDATLRDDPADGSRATASGTVRLRCSGELGEVLTRALGASSSVTLALPARVVDVLRAAADRDERVARRLFANGRAVPAVWRDARRLEPSVLVEDGDVLDLVTAISGG